MAAWAERKSSVGPILSAGQNMMARWRAYVWTFPTARTTSYRLWPVQSVFERQLSASVVRWTDAASIEGLSLPLSMQFSEADAPWQPVPSWADFLIRCGFAWANGGDKRRISVISMPCESAGAGLVALGAIRRRLALDDANDSLSWSSALQRSRRSGRTSLFAVRRRTLQCDPCPPPCCCDAPEALQRGESSLR